MRFPATGAGYGDITPQTGSERVYVIVGLFTGTAFFSYVVGTVCGAGTELI